MLKHGIFQFTCAVQQEQIRLIKFWWTYALLNENTRIYYVKDQDELTKIREEREREREMFFYRSV